MYLPLKSATPMVVIFSLFISQNLHTGIRVATVDAMSYVVMQSLSKASIYYENTVGWKADARPGENRQLNYYSIDMQTGRQMSLDGSLNVIGLNEPLTGDFGDDFFKQGAFLSKTLNRVPAMNATAALHDVWFDQPDGLEFNVVTNLLTMLPAAVISIGAILGNSVDDMPADEWSEQEQYLAEETSLLRYAF